MKGSDFISTTMAEMELGIYDFTVDGKCSNCGQCCANLLPISTKEAKEIMRCIKKHRIQEQKHWAPTVKPGTDLVCPFRSTVEKKCTIYPVRPAICRDFQCDKPRKQIKANRNMYHGRYGIVDMRATFFGKTPVFEGLLMNL